MGRHRSGYFRGKADLEAALNDVRPGHGEIRAELVRLETAAASPNIDERLRAVDSCRIAYPWQGVELDLSIVLGAFDQLLQQLLSKHGRQLEAIGLSTAMHSLKNSSIFSDICPWR